MIFAFVYILLCVYSCLQGVTHGILYSGRAAEAFPWNEHKIYTAERAVVMLLVLISTQLTLEEAICMIPCFMLAFSFWHNGCYYLTRADIDEPYAHWFYDSKTSTASIELNSTMRTVLFLISLLLVTLLIIYKPC